MSLCKFRRNVWVLYLSYLQIYTKHFLLTLSPIFRGNDNGQVS